MIRHKNIDPNSALKHVGRLLRCWYTNTNTTFLLVSTAQGGFTLGTPVTLLNNGLMKEAQSICFTPAVGLGAPWSFDIVGENQFGETVRETVAITVAATKVQSLYCYRRVISITPTAKGTTTDEMAIGTDLTVASGGSPRVAIPCRLNSTGSARFMTMSNAGTNPTFAAIGAPYHAVQIATNPLLGNPNGCIVVWTDEDDGQL